VKLCLCAVSQNFSQYWVVVRKSCAVPPKVRGPRPWPMRKSVTESR